VCDRENFVRVHVCVGETVPKCVCECA
jgi:hypothetical protein